MQAETPPAGVADAPVVTPMAGWRNPKKLVLAGVAALFTVSALGAATWLLWPSAEAHAVAKQKGGSRKAAKVSRPETVAAVGVDAAGSELPALASPRPTPPAEAVAGHETPAPDPHAAAATAAATAADMAAATASPGAQSPPTASHGVTGHPVAAAPVDAPKLATSDTIAASLPLVSKPPQRQVGMPTAASAPALGEDPLDRVRRRLAETLGTEGKLESERAGELRVITRTAPPARPRGELRPNAAVSAVHGAAGLPDHAAAGLPDHAGVSSPMHSQAAHALHWDYSGDAGPQAWASLKPEFATCSSGTRQSPIDIRDGIAVQLDPVKFEYQPSAFSVIDNGHTVQVNVAAGNAIEVLGRRFELLQFHFHRPSEERIAGRQFDMVVHLVHKDAAGRLAVVAVLLDQGSAQGIVQTVWNNLPLEKGEAQAASGTLDLQQLLPVDRSYYTYMGSLTTPPCSEGVLWMVMRQPVPISPEQLAVFARLYPMNARPLQAAAGRLIKQSP